MTKTQTDIIIHGAGIAGLWLHHRLRREGYDCLLLEKNKIGGGQSIASQGIIHSGLKYTLAGKVSELARSISAMPERWRDALAGKGEVDLTAARMNANSQQLLIPSGFMGSIVKNIAGKALGSAAHDIPLSEWPVGLESSGFHGSLVHMAEPVLDIPSVIRALAGPYKESIRQSAEEEPEARLHIYTAAAGNLEAAQKFGQDKGLETQARPLLMGLLKPAPFPLYAHLVGKSDKPVCTITTHIDKDGALIWYLGAQVAERRKEESPEKVYNATLKAFQTYLPQLNFSGVEWATLPIDRIEGKSKTGGWLPDTPTIHETDNRLYCWPTKLTFAPLLADTVIEKIKERGIVPSASVSDWSHLPPVDYALPPWDHVTWTSYKNEN